MALVAVDPSQIKFDAPTGSAPAIGGLVPVDPTQIKFDPPSFAQAALAPIQNIGTDVSAEANAGIDRVTAPFPQPSTGQSYPLARNMLHGLEDVGSRASGVVQYISSPITGTIRALASQPVANIAQAAGLSPEQANTYVRSPIDFAGQFIAPGELAKAAPAILDAVKSSPFLADTSSGPITLPLSQTAPNIAAGFNASDVDALNVAKQAGHDTVSQAYQVPSLQATTLTPEAAGQLNGNILDQIGQSTINPVSSPKTIAAVKQLYSRITDGYTHPITGQVTPDVPLSISELDSYRKLLGNTAGEDSAAAGGVRQTIDDFLNNADQSHLNNGTPQAIQDLNTARATAAQNFKFQDLSDILVKANGNPQKIQTGITKFISDPDNTAGLSDDQISALKQAANGTSAQKTMQMLGKFGFDSNNVVGPGVAAGVLAPVTGFAAPAIPIAGSVLRYGNKLAVRGAAQNAADALAPSFSPSIVAEAAPPAPVAPLQISYQPSATTYGVHPADVPAAETTINASGPAAPPALTAPELQPVIDMNGNVRLQTLQERDAAILQRQNGAQLGITPGTQRAAAQAQSRAIAPGLSQSDIGQFITNNPNLTLQQVMQMSPADAQRLFSTGWLPPRN